jgi:hypothetical protein
LSHSTPCPNSDGAEITDVLRKTRSTLRRAEFALDTLQQTPDRERQVAEMANVVVAGRAVTNVLQLLRSKVEGFDDWYEPWQQQMRQDPLLRYLYRLRSEILKEGEEGATTRQVISFDPVRDLPPAPPGTTFFYTEDENGGWGWNMQLEDGSIQRIYVSIPEDRVRSFLAFTDPPGEHLEAPSHDASLQHVCELYVQYLQRLVDAAERRFAPTD